MRFHCVKKNMEETQHMSVCQVCPYYRREHVFNLNLYCFDAQTCHRNVASCIVDFPATSVEY